MEPIDRVAELNRMRTSVLMKQRVAGKDVTGVNNCPRGTRSPLVTMLLISTMLSGPAMAQRPSRPAAAPAPPSADRSVVGMAQL